MNELVGSSNWMTQSAEYRMDRLWRSLANCILTAARYMICLSLLPAATYPPLCTVSGDWWYPDLTTFTGQIEISLARGGLLNTCTTPAQVLPVKKVFVKVTNGLMTPVNLYPTDCISPRTRYTVRIYDAQHTLIATDFWTVPDAAKADVTDVINGQ